MDQQSGSTIDNVRRPVADTLHEAADSVRQQAERLPGGERVAKAAHGAAGKLDSSAHYLESRDSRQMLQDLWGFIKRHPAQTLLLAGAAGFLIARSLRSD